jgi:shikimate kinase
MQPDGNILLIGARASGKSTIGRSLADRLRRRFVDLDDETLAEFDASSVHEVWVREGEPAWRDAEVRCLDRVLGRAAQVVALGGGTPVIDAARGRIESERKAGRAFVVYLQAPAAELARRLEAMPGDRPSLTGGDVAGEIGEVLAARHATYVQLADRIVSTAGRSAGDVGAELDAVLADG